MRRLWLTSLLAVACTSKDEPRLTPRPAVVAPPLDAGSETADLVMLQRDVDAILVTSCGRCHSWSTRSAVRTTLACGGKGSHLVVPYDLKRSRLYGKVSGAPACGGSMPPMGGLPQGAVDSLRTWILKGAPIDGKPSVETENAAQNDEEFNVNAWGRDD